MTLQQHIAAGVQFLSRTQAGNGGFLAQASQYPNDFSEQQTHETAFFTSLILDALHDVPSASRVRTRAAQFVLAARSPNWSWNYWLPGSAAAEQQPYPNDLDDTACALAAVYREQPASIDGAVLGSLTRHLTQAETQPGGPYQTWLIDTTAYPVWEDIDMAVNANIGYCMSMHGVHLAPLEAYVSAQLSRGQLTSRYYEGPLPVVYFLARWYKGPGQATLRAFVRQACTSGQWADNPLALALLLSSGLRVGLKKAELKTVARQLVGHAKAGCWPARALYYEPPVDGVPYYAGSAALSTAFALEALQLYQTSHTKTTRQPPKPRAIIPKDVELLSSDLRTTYRQFIAKLLAQDTRSEITAMATLTAVMLNRPYSAAIMKQLDLAATHGWAAYTIYDDVLDDEIDARLIGVANFSLRRALIHFKQALPTATAYHAYVERCFTRMDAANTWEVLHARARVFDGTLTLDSLPDYTNYAQLAERSWGHHLAATGVLYAAGYRLDSPEQKRLQIFFRHYLIARQLHDDAHDWEADLSAGRLSAVVSLLLARHARQVPLITVADELAALRLTFWQHTISEVIALITSRLDKAEAALHGMTIFHDTVPYARWVDSLRDAVMHTNEQQHATIKFMESYGQDIASK